MRTHADIQDSELKQLIQSKKIQLAGNSKLKIYGTLSCASGRRMKKQNRVFFKNEQEAIQNDYRPCARCLRKKYSEWIEQGSG
jgi:methylphosphotriester-DNA--protein-cysteine methyltransferase